MNRNFYMVLGSLVDFMKGEGTVYQGALEECNECRKKLSEEGEGLYTLRTDVWLQRFDAAADLYGDSRGVSSGSSSSSSATDGDDYNEVPYEKPMRTYQYNLCKQCYEAFDRRLQQQQRQEQRY